MKNSILIFCIACIGFASTGCDKKEGATNSFKRYGFKNAHIVLRHSGDTRGQEDIFIADYGKYEARITNIEMFRDQGMVPRLQADITKISDLYIVNPMNHTVRHQRNPMLDSMYNLSESDIPTPTEFVDNQMRNNFYKNEGPDTAVGLQAVRWYSPENQSKFWIANGIAIKQRYPTKDGFIGITAVAIDTNWVVDTMVFSIPKEGFEYVEVKPGEQLQQM